MELLIEQGRLADAENLVVKAMVDPDVDGSGRAFFSGRSMRFKVAWRKVGA